MSSDVENIIELLNPREVIGQSIDLLKVREDVSRDTAFELLIQSSAASRRRVPQIAADIVHQQEGA